MKNGFTLIEMSIVLVIIGLLVGGILMGRDLIRAAEIRKTGSELTNLTTAVATFRVKYNCLPGDCPNATDFFGTDVTAARQDSSGATGTCNGDGDGLINAWHNVTNVEAYYAFQQLAMAGLIAGSYPNETGGIGAS